MLQPTHSTMNMNNETTMQKKEITSSYKQHLQFETNTNNNITVNDGISARGAYLKN